MLPGRSVNRSETHYGTVEKVSYRKPDSGKERGVDCELPGTQNPPTLPSLQVLRAAMRERSPCGGMKKCRTLDNCGDKDVGL